MGLAKNSLGTFISQIIAQLLQFALGVMTARLLGPDGKGLLHILIIWLTISTAMGSIGLGPASIYFISKDPKCLPTALGNLLLATGIISVILVCLGWPFLQYKQLDISAQFPLWMWSIIIFLVPIQLLLSFFMQVLSAILRIKEINTVEASRTTVQLFIFILLVVIAGIGFKGAFLAYALSMLFGASVFFLLVLYYGAQPKRPDWTLLVTFLRYGFKAFLFNLLRLLNLRLDALLVASLALGGIQAAGVYSVATNIAELLLFIPTSIRLSLFPMVSSGGTAEANRLTPAACRHTLFLTIILALGVGTLGTFALNQIYGQAFAGAVIPLLFLLPGIVMLSQAMILYGDLLGRGRPAATIVSALISLIVTVILDFMLIPRYGITGAALASSAAYTIEYFVTSWFFIHHSGILWRQFLVLQKSDFHSYLAILPRFHISYK